MGPVNRLLLRFNVCSWERLASAGGMAPVRRLPLRFKFVSWERLPNCVGIAPVSCLFRRNNSVTRELETVTPSQAVMRVVVLQLREALPRRVSLAASSVVQSLTRSAGSGSGIALLLAHAPGVGVAVGVDVDVAVGVAVDVAVAVAVCVGVCVGVADGVAVAVGAGQNGNPRLDKSLFEILLKTFGIHPLS